MNRYGGMVYWILNYHVSMVYGGLMLVTVDHDGINILSMSRNATSSMLIIGFCSQTIGFILFLPKSIFCCSLRLRSLYVIYPYIVLLFFEKTWQDCDMPQWTQTTAFYVSSCPSNHQINIGRDLWQISVVLIFNWTKSLHWFSNLYSSHSKRWCDAWKRATYFQADCVTLSFWDNYP